MCFFKKFKNNCNKRTAQPEQELRKINETLIKIVDQQSEINNELKNKTYTKHYNLIYIFISLGVVFSAALSYILIYHYLTQIKSINLFNESIKSQSLYILSFLFFVQHFILFIAAASPTLFLQLIASDNNIKLDRYTSIVPIMLCLIPFTISIKLSAWNIELSESLNFGLKNINLLPAFIIIIIVSIILLCKLNKYKKTILSVIFSFFILFSLASIYFLITSLNREYYIANSLTFFLLSMPPLALYFLGVNSNDKIDIFTNNIISFLFWLFLYQVINETILLICKEKESEIAYDQIMITFGYQDKDDKVYYIEENFIKTALETKETLIKVENHKTRNSEEKYVSSEYNEYSAHCGKIYWNTGDTVVFKREYGKKFIQIPANKIFEYQGRNITCDIVKIGEETKNITNIMKKSLFELLKYKPFILIKDKP